MAVKEMLVANYEEAANGTYLTTEEKLTSRQG